MCTSIRKFDRLTMTHRPRPASSDAAGQLQRVCPYASQQIVLADVTPKTRMIGAGVPATNELVLRDRQLRLATASLTVTQERSATFSY